MKKKKVYIAPEAKVFKVQAPQILAGSTPDGATVKIEEYQEDNDLLTNWEEW